ncbi:MAG: thrombospondin type 3 repeat-containing protein [candidate division Zixibacteria bacterium]
MKSPAIIFLGMISISLSISSIAEDVTQSDLKALARITVFSDKPQTKVLEPAKSSKLIAHLNEKKSLSSSPFSGQYPAIDRASDGVLAVGYQNQIISPSEIFWAYSLDNGSTWGGQISFGLEDVSLPAIDYYGDGRTFLGASVAPLSFLSGGGVVLYEFGDISDSSTWTAWWSDFSDNGWHSMTSCDIAADNSQQSWNWGLISLVISYTNGPDNIIDAPHIYSQISSLGHVQLSWYPTKPNCNSTTTDIDPVYSKTYSIYDRLEESTQQWELFVRRDNFNDWYLPTTAATLNFEETSKHLKYPAIAAHADTIVIVCEIYNDADPENIDIACWSGFTGNPGEIEYRGLITDNVSDERNPSLSHLGGDDFVCTYVKDYVMYASMTCDGGINWTSPIQIDPETNFPANYDSHDISADGQYLIAEYIESYSSLIDIWELGDLDFDDDGISLCADNCPYHPNPDQTDSDNDGSGDECDLCPDFDDNQDSDSDSVPDGCDNCPEITNNSQSDIDNDNVGDVCDECTDTDEDGYGNPGYASNLCEDDNCPDISNSDQDDEDFDGVGDPCDNCLNTSNPTQTDTDGDSIGDACDECTDTDGDGYGDPGYSANTCLEDNCPSIYNPSQVDSDGDGVGDACLYICGDANHDLSVNVGDAVYLINFVFKFGPAPIPYDSGDANCDLDINVGDAVYLINNIFKAGPDPCSSCP